MRVRLICATAVLGAASTVLTAGGAAAAESTVEPGLYRIAAPTGHCLNGAGKADMSLWLGPCEGPGWQVEATANGHLIRHATTGECLAPSLLRIYPQRAGTQDCAALDERWTITTIGTEGGPWTRITRPDYYTSLSWLSDREPVVLLPQSQTGNQRWEFRRI